MHIFRSIMRGMFKIYSLLFLVLATSLAFSSVMVTEFKAALSEVNKDEILVEWRVQGADNVTAFRVERKLSTAKDYTPLETIDVKPGDLVNGAGRFEYLDRHVFKQSASSDAIFYQLRVFYTDRPSEVYGPVYANYTSTTVRRTWGSIKSMFQ